MWSKQLILYLSLTVLLVLPAVHGSRHIKSFGARRARQDSSEEAEDEEEDTPLKKPAAVVATGNKTAAPVEVLEPVTIGNFRAYVHAIDSGDVIVLDEKTLEIPDFSYDGEGPASWFVVGNDGDFTREFVDLPDYTAIPDENDSCNGLKRYNQETIKLRLPGKLTVHDISYLSVYCLRFNHNFGYVTIPDDIKPPKAKKGTKTDECEPNESGESGQGNRRPAPPPAPAAPAPSGGRPSLLGGLLSVLGR